MSRSKQSLLDRHESRWSIVPRALLIILAVILILGAFVGTIVGIEAVRVAHAKAADRNWRPPASQPSDPTLALLPPAAMTQPVESTDAIPVEQLKPQRIALWASAAKLTGGGVAFGGKRDRVVVGWTSEAARASWTIEPAAGEYYVDVTYTTENGDGGTFVVEAGSETLEADAQRTAGRNTFTTVRMGTIVLAQDVKTFVIRAATPLPKRSLMSLQRVDLRPVGDPESEAAPVVAAGEAVQNVQGLVSARNRRGVRPQVADGRSLLERLMHPGDGGNAAAAQARRDAIAGNIPQNPKPPREARPPSPVTNVLLVDADTGRVLQVLFDNVTINLAALPTRRLSIRADTGAGVTSVRFGLDDRAPLFVSERSPFILPAENGGDGRPLDFHVGEHRLTATSFADAGAAGASATPVRIRFNVIDNASLGEPAVAALNLIDTDTGAVVRSLSDGMKVDVRAVPKHWTVAAAVTGTVQSVRFEWSAAQRKGNHVEDSAPYALAGDNNGKYLPADLETGTIRVTAAPFAEDGAKGKKGRPMSLSFTVGDADGDTPTIVLRAAEAKVRGKDLRIEGDKERRNLGKWTRKDDDVTWNVRPTKPGLYRVELLYACDRKDGGGVFELSVGDHHFTGTATPTAGWEDYRMLNVGELTLTDAKQPVLLKASKLDDGKYLMNVREIRFTQER